MIMFMIDDAYLSSLMLQSPMMMFMVEMMSPDNIHGRNDVYLPLSALQCPMMMFMVVKMSHDNTHDR